MPRGSRDAVAADGGRRVTVIQLSDYGGSYRGSFVPMLAALCRRCGELGWGYECGFTPVARERAWLDELAAAGAEVAFAPQGGYVARARWVRQRLDRINGAKLVHTHFASFDVPAVVATLARDDEQVIWHVHSALQNTPAGLAKGIVHYGVAGRGARGLVCVSDAVREAIRLRGAPGRRAMVIDNGIDVERFRLVNTREREAARRELGLDAGAAVLLHFAWDWEVKGGELFAQTLARLRAASSSSVVGVVVSRDPRAEAAAARLGLGSSMRVEPPAEDVDRFYAAADILLATSPAEGAPLAMLEALACGRPVVATDTPSHRTAGSGLAALRFTPAHPEAIADSILGVLARSPEVVDAEAAGAHRWIRENRGLDAWASRTVGVYRDLLAA